MPIAIIFFHVREVRKVVWATCLGVQVAFMNLLPEAILCACGFTLNIALA